MYNFENMFLRMIGSALYRIRLNRYAPSSQTQITIKLPTIFVVLCV